MHIIDFNNHAFNSIHDMCKAHSVKFDTYRARRAKGMTMQQALVMPVGYVNSTYSRDHLGHEFLSFSDMAKHWSIKPATFLSRLNAGYSIKQALVKPVRILKK